MVSGGFGSDHCAPRWEEGQDRGAESSEAKSKFARGKKRENSREDETVAVQPVGVLGVEPHEVLEEDVGNGSHAPVGGCQYGCVFMGGGVRGGKDSHGSTRVSRVAGKGGINLERMSVI